MFFATIERFPAVEVWQAQAELTVRVEIAAPAELSVEVFESRLRRSSALEVKFAAPVELSG